MDIQLSTPTVTLLPTVTSVLASWQDDKVLNQIHPGDIGWFQRFGAEKAASSIRIWSRASDGEILAIGLLDGDDLLRATIAPSARKDELLARKMADDIMKPERGVLPAGQVSIDVPPDALVRALIAAEAGWSEDEEWTWLRHDIAPDVEANKRASSLLRVKTVELPEQIDQRVAVQKLAFGGSSFTVEKWHSMAESTAYKTSKCLLGYDKTGSDDTKGVCTATLWSTGAGKPAMLEPVGVDAAYQRRGFGSALCRLAAAELGRMGASSVIVNTPSSNASAVAAYKRAGFRVTHYCKDLCRSA